jgi:LacI family kdg operon repressor
MKEKVTISDVAAKAKVSKTTLSRYLNGEFERMSVETKERIRQVIEALNYKPNPQARGLKNKKSYLIGLVVADILNYYSSVLIKGLQNALSNTDYQLLIMTADNLKEKEEVVIEKLLRQNIDGLILQPTTTKLENYQAIIDSETPTVLIDRLLDKKLWSTVQSNNYEVTSDLIKHAADLGYEKVVHVSTPLENISPRIERYEAVKHTAEKCRMKFTFIEIKDDKQTIIDYFKEDARKEKTVIFAANRNNLYEVIKATTKLNLTIPDSYGVCGYDDWYIAEGIAPGITAVEQDLESITNHLVKNLLKNMNGERNAEVITVPAKINYRNSL